MPLCGPRGSPSRGTDGAAPTTHIPRYARLRRATAHGNTASTTAHRRDWRPGCDPTRPPSRTRAPSPRSRATPCTLRPVPVAVRRTRVGTAAGAPRRTVAPLSLWCDGAPVPTPQTYRGGRPWPNPPACRNPPRWAAGDPRRTSRGALRRGVDGDSDAGPAPYDPGRAPRPHRPRPAFHQRPAPA